MQKLKVKYKTLKLLKKNRKSLGCRSRQRDFRFDAKIHGHIKAHAQIFIAASFVILPKLESAQMSFNG